MKYFFLASLITLLAFGTACGQAAEPEPVSNNGIQVHGHWTVTVTNPDGTVDAVHEFENALTEYGARGLTAILMGEAAVEEWLIKLKGQSEWLFSCTGAQKSGLLLHLIPASAYRDVEVDEMPIKLSGLCTANNIVQEKGTISVVGITIKLDSCIKNTLGDKTCTTTDFSLTSHVFDPVIEVTENQALSFNISLSFPYGDPNV